MLKNFLQNMVVKKVQQARVDPVGIQLFKVRKIDIFKVCNEHSERKFMNSGRLRWQAMTNSIILYYH